MRITHPVSRFKMQEIKIITVKVPLHCPDCAVRVREILLEHKSNFLSDKLLLRC